MRMKTKRIIIMGAGGRDFHNFNVRFRDDPGFIVAAFTAAQIPYISRRAYPPPLAGKLYPKGIRIYPEDELERLIHELRIDTVVFAYSDVSHMDVMHKASRVLAAGADFMLLGPDSTMLESSLPVISVCAVRTGCGKSPVTRKLLGILRKLGRKPVAIRHPMAYCDFSSQAVQRFASMEDIETISCTVEEKEEYEPIVEQGFTVFAGVDYQKILKAAEAEADVIVWDGGNNDFSFIRPGLDIVVADALRPGHETLYHPGETNLRRADIVIINKAGKGSADGVKEIRRSVRQLNPDAIIITAESPAKITMRSQGVPTSLKGMRALIIEDGPTVTHGGMPYGAGYVAAKAAGAIIVEPRPYAVGSLIKAFADFPHLKEVLPALGYSKRQLGDLEATIDRTPCDAVVYATPVNLPRLIKINRHAYRVSYDIKEKGGPRLEDAVREFLEKS